MTCFYLNDIAATRNWAREFAKKLPTPQTIALHGDLGMGKSEIARAIIQELCGEDTVVPSPTFTLVQTYETRRASRVTHFDLYRITDESELVEIGLSHAVANDIVLIEWPEIAKDFLPPDAVHIYITEEGAGRKLCIGQK